MELRERCACRLHRLRSSGQGMWRGQGRAGRKGRGGEGRGAERRGEDGGAMYLRGNARARRVPVQVDKNMNFLRVYNRDLQPSKSLYDSSSGRYCEPPPTPAHDRHRSQTPQDPQQMWPGWAQSRCRCGRCGPSPGADAARTLCAADKLPSSTRLAASRTAARNLEPSSTSSANAHAATREGAAAQMQMAFFCG